MATSTIPAQFVNRMFSSTLLLNSRAIVQHLIVNRLSEAPKVVLNTVIAALGFLPFYALSYASNRSERKIWTKLTVVSLLEIARFNLLQWQTSHEYYPLQQSKEKTLCYLAYNMIHCFFFHVSDMATLPNNCLPIRKLPKNLQKIVRFTCNFFTCLLAFSLSHRLSHRTLNISEFAKEIFFSHSFTFVASELLA